MQAFTFFHVFLSNMFLEKAYKWELLNEKCKEQMKKKSFNFIIFKIFNPYYGAFLNWRVWFAIFSTVFFIYTFLRGQSLFMVNKIKQVS